MNTAAQQVTVSISELRKRIADALDVDVSNVKVRISSGDEWTEVDATIELWHG